MLGLTVEGSPLLLAADASADLEYRNPKLQDALEDDHSLPFSVPVQGNEQAMRHAHQLSLAQRTLVLQDARLSHQGQHAHSGVLHLLGSTPKEYSVSFSVEGFAARLRGKRLRELLADQVIELPAGAAAWAKDVTMQPIPHESHAFPMHLNRALYGSANPHWDVNASKWSATATYSVDNVVAFTETHPVLRERLYQCIESTSAGQSPITHPTKWKRVVFSLVNSYDADAEAYDENADGLNYHALVPWFRFDWIIKTALAKLGLRATGDWFDDHLTPRLLLPNATPLDGTKQDGLFGAQQTTPTNYGVSGTPFDGVPLPLDDDTSAAPYLDPDDLYDTGSHTFVIPTPGIYRFRWHVEGELALADHMVVRLNNVGGGPIWMGGSGSLQPHILSPSQGTLHNYTQEVLVDIQPENAGTPLKLTIGAQHHGPFMPTASLTNCSLIVSATSQPQTNAFANRIDPAQHVPDIDLGSFLQQVATTFGLEVVPDLEKGEVQINIKERLLRDRQPVAHWRTRHHRTTDASHRQSGDITIDHQRAIAGMGIKWDLPNTTTTPPMGSLSAGQVMWESDATPPSSPGQHLVVISTRKLYRSILHRDTLDHVWEHHGYLLPPAFEGDPDRVTTLPIKPLHMEEVTIDGRRVLVPVMDHPGSSTYFATTAEQTEVYVAVNLGPMPDFDGEVLYPSAGSWGVASDGSPCWSLSTEPVENSPIPSIWQHLHQRWARALVNSLPVTTDLVVDRAFLIGRERNDILHIHGHDYLLESLPVKLAATKGPLVCEGAYLRKLVPLPVHQDDVPMYMPPQPEFTCVGPNMISIDVTEVHEWASVMAETSGGYFAVRGPGGIQVIPYGNQYYFSPDNGGAGLGHYCIWPSDEDGNPSGQYELVEIYGPGIGLSAQDVVSTSMVLDVSAVTNSEINLSGFLPMLSYALTNSPNLTTIIGYDLSICVAFNAVGSALNQTTVDDILVAAAAKGSPIHVQLHGGTNAAPSAVGLAAKATIIGNGGFVTHN